MYASVVYSTLHCPPSFRHAHHFHFHLLLSFSGASLGPAVLFFGCRTQADYIYRKELEEFVNEGVLSNVFVAFSREGPEKVYVQDLIAKNASLVWEMLDPSGRNGYFYICGDAKRMARDVHDALAEVTSERSNCSKETALHVLDAMMEKNHYMKDVY